MFRTAGRCDHSALVANARVGAEGDGYGLVERSASVSLLT